MSKDEQSTYGVNANVGFLERREDFEVADESKVTQGKVVSARLADSFCGLGSTAWPYAPEHFERAIRDLYGLDGAAPLPGHRQFCNRMRKLWIKDVLVDDVAAIPKSARVAKPLTCWEAHPGLCRSEDAWCWPEALQLAKLLLEHFITQGDPGMFYRISFQELDATSPIQVHLAMGYKRKGAPRLVHRSNALGRQFT
jgi:hypothetical protein